VFYFYIANL